MSGEKYTQVRLQRERQEKLNLLQSLQSLQSESAALQKQWTDQINGMSEGLRSTFDTEVAASRQWLHGTTPVDTYSMDHSLDDLRQTQRRQEQVTNSGRTCLRNLQLALTQKADAIGRAVAEQRVAITQDEPIGESPIPSQEETLLDALKRLRELGTFSKIDDPVAWQREIRKDRPILGRD